LFPTVRLARRKLLISQLAKMSRKASTENLSFSFSFRFFPQSALRITRKYFWHAQILGQLRGSAQERHAPKLIESNPDREVAVQIQWITQRHVLASQFRSLTRLGLCSPTGSRPLTSSTNPSRSWRQRSSDLGDAEYLFKDNPPVRLPWKHSLIDSSPDLPPGTFHLLAFSRVVFTWDRREALFSVSDACALWQRRSRLRTEE
jgi:hypothetical protein